MTEQTTTKRRTRRKSATPVETSAVAENATSGDEVVIAENATSGDEVVIAENATTTDDKKPCGNGCTDCDECKDKNGLLFKILNKGFHAIVEPSTGIALPVGVVVEIKARYAGQYHLIKSNIAQLNQLGHKLEILQ